MFFKTLNYFRNNLKNALLQRRDLFFYGCSICFLLKTFLFIHFGPYYFRPVWYYFKIYRFLKQIQVREGMFFLGGGWIGVFLGSGMGR